MNKRRISSTPSTSKSIRARTSDKKPFLNANEKGNVVHVVVDALENPKYKWRTVAGVSSDAGVEPLVVYRVIEKLGAQVVKSSVASTTGDELFTTRRHLRQKESLLSRVGAVLRNRAA
jgi:hypothetical protein